MDVFYLLDLFLVGFHSAFPSTHVRKFELKSPEYRKSCVFNRQGLCSLSKMKKLVKILKCM